MLLWLGQITGTVAFAVQSRPVIQVTKRENRNMNVLLLCPFMLSLHVFVLKHDQTTFFSTFLQRKHYVANMFTPRKKRGNEAVFFVFCLFFLSSLQFEHRTRKLKLEHGDTFGVEKYIQEHKTEMIRHDEYDIEGGGR